MATTQVKTAPGTTNYYVQVGPPSAECKKPKPKPITWPTTVLKVAALFSAFAATCYGAYWLGAHNAAASGGKAFEEFVRRHLSLNSHVVSDSALVTKDQALALDDLSGRFAAYTLENTPGPNLEAKAVLVAVKDTAAAALGYARDTAAETTGLVVAASWNALPASGQVTGVGLGLGSGVWALKQVGSLALTIVRPFTSMFGVTRAMRGSL